MTWAEMKAALRRDFERNDSGSDRITVVVFRLGQYLHGKRRSRLPLWLLWRIADGVYLRILIGAELPPTVRCGPGLILAHRGQGVILHPRVVIGADARIYQRVTIGITEAGGVPTLGDDVYVGAGASILGGITVGDGSRIGAGAVVVKHDVPPHSVAMGVPATSRPLRKLP